MRMRFVVAAGVTLALAVPVVGPAIGQDSEGVKVSRKSVFRYVVGAETIEKQSEAQYLQMTRQAFQKRALVEENNPQVLRLRKIARDLLPGAKKFNERAGEWKWEVNLLNSQQINAFCMPGGKIAFYTGIIDKLQLTDDEIAMVMGHEIGHALWEHARERAGKGMALNAGRAFAGLLFGQLGDVIGAGAGSLATLKFSRNDELEADLIGMELAARAGYDPRSGITLWQKMGQANKGAPPQWMSTHPAGATRIDLIKKHLPEVMGLYERAKVKRAG
jgi:predicted Zn-dependent protease